MKHIATAMIFLVSLGVQGQNVGIGTNTPHPSARLEVSSTNSGLLPPRMTLTQIFSIPNPVAGLIAWCNDCDTSGQLLVYNGRRWITGISTPVSQPIANWNHSCGTPNIHNANLTYGVMSDQQGNTYKTIQIGTQTWMAENLKTGIYRNGESIPNVNDRTDWQNLATGAWCNLFNSLPNECPHGKLYNWYAVDDVRGLCPNGWHVPTDAEFTTLNNTLGGSNVAGGKLKSISDLWDAPNTNADNSTGFSGLPGGYRDPYGSFVPIGTTGFWWSSTQYNAGTSWNFFLKNDNANGNKNFNYKTTGFSVRCLRD
jgi:uncharacterized protein (TIGR02145 family)